MRPWLRRSLVTIALLLVLLPALLLYLLHQPEFVSRQLKTQLLAATGWELDIDGGLDLQWGGTSRIAARDLRLVNPHWPRAMEMFSARELTLEFQPLELLHGRLGLEYLNLKGCQLHLDRDGEGGSNWALQHEPGRTPSVDVADEQADEPGFDWKFALLEIDNCQLSSSIAGQEKKVELRLDSASIREDQQRHVEISAHGAVDQQELVLEGNIEPLHALWKGGALRHTIHLQAGEISLNSEGSVTGLAQGEGADLNLHFEGPEFGQITEWLGLPDFSQGPFDARITVKRQVAGARMDIGVAADLGNLEISGHGELDRIFAPGAGNLELHASGPDLDALGRTFGVSGLLARPFEVDLRAAIEDRETRLDTLDLTVDDDRLQVQGVLGAWPGFAGCELEANVHSPSLSAWMPASAGAGELLGSFDSRLRLVTVDQSRVRLEANGQLEQLASQTDQAFTLAAEARLAQESTQLDRLDLAVGDDRLALKGTLRLPDHLQGSEVELTLELADLAQTGLWFGLQDLPAKPAELQAQVGRKGKGLVFQVSADRDSGQEIHISGDVPDLADPLALNAEFDIALPSLRLAQFLAPEATLPDLPLSARGRIRNDTAAQTTRVEELELNLGRTSARVQAELQLREQLQGSTAHWTVESPDWPELCGEACDEWSSRLEAADISGSGQWRREDGIDYFESVRLDSSLANLQASGRLEPPAQDATGMRTRPLEFSVNIQGDDASRLNGLVGPLFDSQGISLKSTLRLDRGHLRASGVELRQGAMELFADVEADLVQRPKITARVHSPLLDISVWRNNAIAAMEQAGGGQTASNGKPAKRELLFRDEDIRQLGELPVDLLLDLDIEQLLVGTYRLRQLRIDAELVEQALKVSDFRFAGDQGGHYAGHLNANQREGVTQISLFTQADDLKLGLIGTSGQDPATLPPSDILLDLAGKGRTWHELAVSLTGSARWYAGAGRVSDSGLDILFGDLLTQVLDTLNPLSKSRQYTELGCAVYAADFADGKVNMAPIVIQTDKITAFSSGQVDLASESIDLNFNTVPRKGLGISAGSVVNPFFRIGGTLMKPAVELDVTKGAISGGVMVATAGLSVLFKSLSDRLLASKDPCGDARAEIERADLAQPGQ